MKLVLSVVCGTLAGMIAAQFTHFTPLVVLISGGVSGICVLIANRK